MSEQSSPRAPATAGPAEPPVAAAASGASAAPRWRATRVAGCVRAEAVRRADGSWLVRSTEPLSAYPERITDALEHFARVRPNQVFVARRAPGHAPAIERPWQTITYAQMLERVRRVGQALALRMADGEISEERPIAILSGNDLQHLTLALAACWVGVPYAPVSPAYSTLARDTARLAHIFESLTPGLVFASAWGPYGRAIEAVLPTDAELVLTDPTGITLKSGQARTMTRFSALVESTPGAALELAHNKVGPDTIAKFLFTSGSTKQPKGVVTTNGMWCANLQQIRQCFAFLADEPPVLVDWLPWNHVFGGNHNVGIALYNGGTLYIDDGRPVAAGMAETVANLREISPTVYFNVPKGFEELAAAMETDEALRRSVFTRVRAFMYAGAGLSQAVWDHLDRLAERTIGERIPIFTGLGMTETSPSCTFALGTQNRAGDIGLPVPGVEVKIVPVEGKQEIRFRGPNVMSEYWRAFEETAAAFDSEGFYRTGDAVRFREPGDSDAGGDVPPDPTQGLVFDGRIAEDFKLATGTFVSVGPLRTQAILSGHPMVQDVVVAGVDRDDIGLLVFPRVDDVRRLAGAVAGEPLELTLAHPQVRGFFRQWLKALWDAGTGSSNRPARALLLSEPPSLDRGEVTDKGSINLRAVLQHRAEAVERLYADKPDAAVIRVGGDR
ncbi:MAG: feruloyl-CoA synthase [Betaproteobacteria bacterium]|nr:feruloyl-CoA synthase [Betaproteobacteria bacterium]MCC6246925.1 feruloyl-CoA synthase [Rubrivivax sp.]